MIGFSYSILKRIRLAANAIAVGLFASTASAQVSTPIHVGNTASIVNEFGDTLPGNSSAPGALVMVLWAPSNTIYAPSIDGQPNALNPPVSNGLTAIGRSIAPWLLNSGRFSISLASPRPTSGKLFVRVFNKPTLAESSFYADSQIFTISGNQEFFAAVGPTTNALDTADDDNDGLNNSWEKSYGSDPNDTDSDDDGITDGVEHTLGSKPALADTDSDGVNDGDELRAGTGLTDSSSFLGMAALTPQAGNLVVSWDSVTGHYYQVEGAQGLMNSTFNNLTDVIPAGTGTQTSVVISNALAGTEPLIIRVRLVEE